ncbi:MAG: FG-GAP repeat protein, partial [Roseimicrobium sp.]
MVLAILSLSTGAALHAQMTAVRSYPPGLGASSRMGISSRSVAIGNGMIAVGAPYHAGVGAVFVFEKQTGKHLFTLPGSAHTGAELFGWAIDISGTKLLVGAPFTDLLASGNAGAAYVFDLQTRRLVQSIISANFLAGDNWGYSVDLDGDLIALGATYADTRGAVELWRLGNPNRLQRIQTLLPLVANNARFGQALALENGILAVGAPGEYVTYTGNHAGRFFVFDAVSNTQLFEGSITGGAGEEFGSALAMNGNLLAVAAPGVTPQNGGPGLVAIYRLNDLNGGYGSYGGVGAISSVAIDEGRLAMSAPDSAVRLGNGVDEYLPYPTGVLSGDSLGASLAVRGSLVVTTAPGDDSGSSDGGALWRFLPVAQVASPDSAFTTGDSMPSSGNGTLSAIGPAVVSQFGNPVMIGTLMGA